MAFSKHPSRFCRKTSPHALSLATFHLLMNRMAALRLTALAAVLATALAGCPSGCRCVLCLGRRFARTNKLTLASLRRFQPAAAMVAVPGMTSASALPTGTVLTALCARAPTVTRGQSTQRTPTSPRSAAVQACAIAAPASASALLALPALRASAVSIRNAVAA